MLLKESKSLLFVLAALCILASCTTKNNPAFDDSNLQSNVSPQATKAAGAFLNQYLELKKALVATNSTHTHRAAQQMTIDMDSFQTILRNDTAASLKELMVQADSIQMQLKTILGNDNPNCEPQRIAFKYLSDNMLSLLKIIKINHLHLYIQYTPLALNERGGTWLSTSDEIENPYFGSKMLTCGEVIDTLK